MSSGRTPCILTEFPYLTNDLVLVGKNTPKHTYLMHKENHRKPIELKEFSSYSSETFILWRVLPVLLFILEQAVTNALPAVSSVCSGLQFLRSVMHQCGKSSSSEVRGSASGAGRSSSAFSTTAFSAPLSALFLTQRALWHHQCKN